MESQLRLMYMWLINNEACKQMKYVLLTGEFDTLVEEQKMPHTIFNCYIAWLENGPYFNKIYMLIWICKSIRRFEFTNQVYHTVLSA